MNDDFVSIILDAIKKIDISCVISSTNHLNTVYSGQRAHVLDCTKAAFICAYRKQVHMTGVFSFSGGFVNDTEISGFPDTVGVLHNADYDTSGGFMTFAKLRFSLTCKYGYSVHNRGLCFN